MKVKKMTKESALKIMTWTYEEPYKVYSLASSEEVFKELIDGSYYEVEDESLIGYYCYGKNAQVPPEEDIVVYDGDFIDIGLGLIPKLCGKGKGKEFVTKCIEFAKEEFKNNSIRLTVLDFNIRAIKVYESLGFKKTVSFKRNGKTFIVMENKS